MINVIPFLWFNDQAEAAADFYCSVFPRAKKLNELRVTEAGPGPVGSLLVVDLEIEGQQVTFLNGGSAFQLNEAFSFVVLCETQEEIDEYWAKLTADGGVESQCGWLKDKFGVSWQITPVGIKDWVGTPAGMMAMMGMKKLDIAVLKAAAERQ
jgi:predicted 3-demethylubiquinone-9 3-methyltransferase (glyoxalase superfamily)